MRNMHGIYKNGPIIRNEGGFTLLELVIVIAVMAVVASAMAITISVMTTISASTTEQYMAMSQVEVAGNTIIRDVASSCNVTAGSEGTWQCSMNRYTWNGSDNLTTVPVVYTITNGVLERTVNSTNKTRIAENLVNPGTDTSFLAATENNTYIVKLTSQFNDASFSMLYKVVCKSP